MGDMLVQLNDLPGYTSQMIELEKTGVEIRHAMPYEKHQIVQWVKSQFSAGWSSECDVSFSRQPPACIIAVDSGNLVGFACYESTYKNFFGPLGVAESARGRGIGYALVIRSLHAMLAMGYAYAIIGDAENNEFYRKTVGAMTIANQKSSYPDALE